MVDTADGPIAPSRDDVGTHDRDGSLGRPRLYRPRSEPLLAPVGAAANPAELRWLLDALGVDSDALEQVPISDPWCE